MGRESSEAVYAGLVWRVMAAAIDWFALALIALAMLFIIALAAAAQNSDMARLTGLDTNLLVPLVQFLSYTLYFTLMESSRWQATLGKKALGLKVTDSYGNRISFGTALLRTLAKLGAAIPLFAGIIMIHFTGRKQGLHDIVAGSFVRREGMHETQIAGHDAVPLKTGHPAVYTGSRAPSASSPAHEKTSRDDSFRETIKQAYIKSILPGVFMLMVILAAAVTLLAILAALPISHEAKIAAFTLFIMAALFIFIQRIVASANAVQEESAKLFDETFAPYGLEGKAYAMWGRQYHGSYKGRGLHIYLSRVTLRNRFLGWRMQVSVETGVKVRMGVSPKNALTARAVSVTKAPVFDNDYVELSNTLVTGQDLKWIGNWFEEREPRSLVHDLFPDTQGMESVSIVLQPGAASLFRSKIPIENITSGDNAAGWIEKFLALVESAESAGAPYIIEKERYFDRFTLSEGFSGDRLRQFQIAFFIMVLVGMAAAILIILNMFM